MNGQYHILRQHIPAGADIRFVAYFCNGNAGYSFAPNVSYLLMTIAAARAACFFKLPVGASAIVDIYYEDLETRKHVFYVQIINSHQPNVIPDEEQKAKKAIASMVKAPEAAAVGLMGFCMAECPAGSNKYVSSDDMCDLLSHSASCSSATGSVTCVGGGGG